MKKVLGFIKDKMLFVITISIAVLLYLHIKFFPNFHVGFFALGLSLLALYSRDTKIKALRNKQYEMTQIINNLFDKCPDYIFIKDLNSKYIAANKSMLKFLNLTEEEFINKTDHELFSREIANLRLEQDKKVIKNAEILAYDASFNVEGKEIILEITKSPLLNENKEVLGIIAILRDVTYERISKAKLEKDQYILLSIIDNFPFIAYLRDLEGNLIYKNKLCDDLFGMDPDSDGTSYSRFFNENKEDILKLDAEVLKTKKPCVLTREFLINNRNCFLLIHKIPIFKGESVDKLLIVARDITVDKEIETQKENFVATLSHDLKTPTTAQIKALEHVLNSECIHLCPNDRDLLTEVYNSCKYMYRMINNLIFTYKYSDGKMELKPESFDLIELLTECCREMRYFYEERSQVINFEFDIDKCFIVADRLEIKRVIINLLSNAISYSLRDSAIRVYLKEKKEKVSFSISNNTSNIKEEDLSTFFDKFISGTDGYKDNSSGLGLYLSKQIIEAHGGTISVKKQDDNCIFTFELFKSKKIFNRTKIHDKLM